VIAWMMSDIHLETIAEGAWDLPPPGAWPVSSSPAMSFHVPRVRRLQDLVTDQPGRRGGRQSRILRPRRRVANPERYGPLSRGRPEENRDFAPLIPIDI
jgi:hypothetical protein